MPIFSSALGSAAGPGQGKAAIHNGKWVEMLTMLLMMMLMTVFADRVEQHIHFWLGEEASTDEAAIAAYKVNFFNIINDMLVYGRNPNEKQMTTMIFSVSGARRAPGRGGDPAQGGSGSRKQEVRSSLTE